MKIEYYSELLNKRFDSEQECLDAENKFKKEEKSKREKLKIREARLAELNEEFKKLKKMEDDFKKEYGELYKYNSKYMANSDDALLTLLNAIIY